MFDLLLFIGMSVLVSFTVGLIAGYAGLCHHLFDKLAMLRKRKAILNATRPERQANDQ